MSYLTAFVVTTLAFAKNSAIPTISIKMPQIPVIQNAPEYIFSLWVEGFIMVKHHMEMGLPRFPSLGFHPNVTTVQNFLQQLSGIALVFCSINIFVQIKFIKMAKKTYMLYKLVSSCGTGYNYFGKKATSRVLDKRMFRKYDPMINQYVVFYEQKLKSGRKK